MNLTQLARVAATPPLWRAKTFKIKTRAGTETVTGWAQGYVAYHQQTGLTTWAVVHVPLGLALSQNIRTKGLARETAQWLVANLPQLTTVRTKAQVEQVLKAGPGGLPGVMQTLKRLRATSLKPKAPKANQKFSQQTKELFQAFPFEDLKAKADRYWQEARDRGLVDEGGSWLSGNPTIRVSPGSGKDRKGTDSFTSATILKEAIGSIVWLTRLVNKCNAAELWTPESRKWYDKDMLKLDKACKQADKLVKAH